VLWIGIGRTRPLPACPAVIISSEGSAFAAGVKGSSAQMRLVFIDSETNRVCGDTAALATRSPEWINAAVRERDPERLARTAARLLDESLGRTYRTYNFASFAPRDSSAGYFVFRCDCEGVHFPLVASDQSDSTQAVSAVMTSCFYVGYVLCDVLVI
jgi:hypothetical protein